MRIPLLHTLEAIPQSSGICKQIQDTRLPCLNASLYMNAYASCRVLLPSYSSDNFISVPSLVINTSVVELRDFRMTTIVSICINTKNTPLYNFQFSLSPLISILILYFQASTEVCTLHSNVASFMSLTFLIITVATSLVLIIKRSTY